MDQGISGQAWRARAESLVVLGQADSICAALAHCARVCNREKEITASVGPFLYSLTKSTKSNPRQLKPMPLSASA